MDGEHEGLHALQLERALARRNRAHRTQIPEPETYAESILARVRAIPAGYVRAYGDIDPHAPRAVGRVLATCDAPDVPWHRVIRADGSVPKGERQLRLLRGEGVPIAGKRVDLKRARVVVGRGL